MLDYALKQVNDGFRQVSTAFQRSDGSWRHQNFLESLNRLMGDFRAIPANSLAYEPGTMQAIQGTS